LRDVLRSDLHEIFGKIGINVSYHCKIVSKEKFGDRGQNNIKSTVH
jgi:hypothetical protein